MFAQCSRNVRVMFAMKDAKREEMQLFRLAQDSLVHRAPTRSLGVIGQLCGLISLYGTSVTRPIIVLVLSNAACYFVYFTFGLLRTRPLTQPASVAAAHLLKQIFSPFSLWRKQHEPTWADSGLLWLRILSCVQSLLTLTALALLSIALHWRFRKA